MFTLQVACRHSFACVVYILFAASAFAADPFAEGVRKTEPLTPEQEQKAFRLLPGFEIQLVAAEPDIHKPINMAFDARGRLWVTSTVEYPFPAKPGTKARDQILILEDKDGDGRAEKITPFAEGLNIPIGLYPCEGGAIGHSIPWIYRFHDTDGDGRADKQDELYGPIGFERDTHGMTSAFRRGFDGWLYACHGFNNNTTIKGKDGSSITMNSGNTYRMKLDGSRVEQFTWGQVNPFGIAFDPLGNLFTADCHSSPIYQILRGGRYPSFGKPHDGLGFGPTMIKHTHGSTAIGGICFYADDKFPQEFHDNIIVGNPMTSRINRDILADHGSTRIANESPDFLSCSDPWFRPVDIQLGPDGAIYVADFYNRIIGHYEVPLTHPGRDRERGRIWRIVYTGDKAAGTKTGPMSKDLTAATAEELIAALGNSNLTLRMLATNQLSDRIGNAATEPAKQILRNGNAFQKIHALWLLYRLGTVESAHVEAAAVDGDRGVRVHAMRVLSELPALTEQQRALAAAALKDADGFVVRAAVDALGRHPSAQSVRPLLDLRHSVSAADTHLVYTVRMALRDLMKAPENFKHLPLDKWTEQDSRAIADVAAALTSPEAGAFLAQHIQKFEEPPATLAAYLRQAVRSVAEADIDGLAALIRERFKSDPVFQLDLFKAVLDGAAQRGTALSDKTKAWGAEIAANFLTAKEGVAPAWANTPVEGAATANPWTVQQRPSADGNKAAPFYSSLPQGEQLTGTLRSNTFKIPATITFFMAGHNGLPPREHAPKNFVRLRDAGTQAVLMEAVPPRNDLAQPFKWDLKAYEGKDGYIELLDGDTARAYAWLAVGRFNPPVVEVPAEPASHAKERLIAAIDIARALKLADLQSVLLKTFGSKSVEADVRAAAAKALSAINAAAHVDALGRMLQDGAEAAALRESVAQVLGDMNLPQSREVLAEALRLAPERQQLKLALALASGKEGAELLLKRTAEGKLSPRLLQEKKVVERIDAAKIDGAAERIASLTKGLVPLDQELQKTMNKRRAAFSGSRTVAAKGEELFTKSCAVCHQLEGKGALVGPQLDGIGNRGLERLVEDVLDPNRNVDPMFRYSTITLNDGRVLNGLQRREEGETVVIVDSTGKEVSFQKNEIKKRVESKYSLMPDNFGEAITAEDFNHLMAYLLSKKNNK